MCRLCLPPVVACCKSLVASQSHQLRKSGSKNIRERHLNGVIIFAPSLGSFGSELIACHIINLGSLIKGFPRIH